MLDYKGAYDAGTAYNAGAVVVFTDGVAYHAFKNAAAGINCHDTHCWERLRQPLQEIVMMFHGMLNNLETSAADASAVIFNPNTLILGVDGSDTKYAVTVDASGETPELAVEEVTDGDDT